MAPPGYLPLQQQWAYAELIQSSHRPGDLVTPISPYFETESAYRQPDEVIETQYPGETIELPKDASMDKATALGGGNEGPSAATLWKAKGIAAAIKGLGQSYVASMGLKTQASLLESQAAMADVNAKLMDLGVDVAYRKRDAEIGNLTLRAGQIKAQQRVAFASRGVALGVGSTAEVAASTELQKEVDVLTAEMNGLMSAWNYKRQAAMFRAQAEGARNSAKIYRHAAPVVGGLYAGSALASLIGGAMGG